MTGMEFSLLTVAAGLAIVGILGYMLAKRPSMKSRSAAITLFAHGSLCSAGLFLFISIFHFHSLFSVHIHDLNSVLHENLENCGIFLECALTTVPLITFGILASSFWLNQLAAFYMVRGYERRTDWESTRKVQEAFRERRGLKLLVVKDPVPDAFSFARLRLKALRPSAEDVIILTRGLVDILDDKELHAVLAHEMAHVMGRDNRYLPFFQALSTLVFFDPIIRLVRSKLVRRQEFSADEYAASVAGDPLILARALFKVCSHSREHLATQSGFAGKNLNSLLLKRIARLTRLQDRQAREE